MNTLKEMALNSTSFLKNNVDKKCVCITSAVFIIIAIYSYRYATFTYVEFDLIKLSPIPMYVLSGIAYISIGALLYKLKFFSFFWKILPRATFKKFKALVWPLVVFLTLYLVHLTVQIVNKIIEFVCNFFAFLLFL